MSLCKRRNPAPPQMEDVGLFMYSVLGGQECIFALCCVLDSVFDMFFGR